MPKEITYTADPSFLKMPDGNEFGEGSPDADAALKTDSGGKWQRRGVHVGWVKNGKGNTIEIGVAEFDPSREQPTHGAFLNLDREGVNQLIRSLRKARDQALGADA